MVDSGENHAVGQIDRKSIIWQCQQSWVLDTEVKLIHAGIRMAAYNTAMTIAREIRTNTGYRRANQEAHALMRQVFNRPDHIDTTTPGHLTVNLDPLPTKAKIAAAAQLCEHLSNIQSRYPGTWLVLNYAIKTTAPAPIN